MKTDESVLSSGAQRSERASEPAAAPAGLSSALARQESRLQARSRELRRRLALLPRADVDDRVTARKRAKLSAQLTAVVKRLFNLRQARLL